MATTSRHPHRRTLASVALLACAAPPTAIAQSPVSRVSVDSSGAEGNGDSGSYYDYYGPAISLDGRYVAFSSIATNLVVSDTNGLADVFVHDRWNGTTVRVSVSSSGTEANYDCGLPALSADGRYVVFSSGASNLVANDRNGALDVFLHDRDSDGNGIFDEGYGTTTRVSVSSSGGEAHYGESWLASISADGHLVVFLSGAQDLVPEDKDDLVDVYAHDVSTGATFMVSVSSAGAIGNADSKDAAVAGDGNSVAFSSEASNLVASDTNQVRDVFVRDLVAGTTVRISVDPAGNQVADLSDAPSVSSDGRLVAFPSNSDDLVVGDVNGWNDVFVRDMSTGTTTLVSVDSAGNQGDAGSMAAAISADGSTVAFMSWATDLIPSDDNGLVDVFAHDLASGATTCVSRPCGIPADSLNQAPALSDDGRFVAYYALSDNLVGGDSNGAWDVFVNDRSISGAAGWSNYGSGFPGTNGTPTLTAAASPVLGTTLTVDLANSFGDWTVALLLAGTGSTSLPTGAGGTILVDELLFADPIVLLPAVTSLSADLPLDPALCGFSLFAQAIELDPGATHGLSFTAGLELDFGG